MSSSDYITPDYDDALTFSAIAAAVEMDLVQLREALEKAKADPNLSLDHLYLLPTANTVLAHEFAAVTADLQTLRDSDDFKHFCLARTSVRNPADLIVNEDGTLGINGWDGIYHSLPPVAAAPARLKKQLTAFARTAAKFGGQLRTQGTLNATCMLKYYGVHTLPVAAFPQESLERLNDGDLAYRIIDRQAVEPVLDDIDKALVIETVDDVKGLSGSLIEHLQGSIPDTVQTDAIRKRPFAQLVELLESPKAQALGQRLLEALGWYGAEPGQSTSAVAVYKLLEQAVALDLDATGQLLGNWLKADEYSGKTNKQSLQDIESKLYTFKELSSPGVATLAVLAMRNQLPLDYQIADVPETLRYRRNLIWFRFAQALAVAEVIEPGLAKVLNYPQLLALREAEFNRLGDDALLMALYSAEPLLQWAVANNYYGTWQPTAAQVPEIQKTFSEIYEQPLQKALLELSKAVPMRLEMAKEELKKHNITTGQLLERHTSGLPLTTPIVGSGGGLTESPGAARHWSEHQTATIEDLVAAGEFFKGQNNWIIPGARRRYHYPGKVDINEKFERDYDAWLNKTKKSYATIVAVLIDSLPLEERLRLAKGQITLCGLKKFPKNSHNPHGQVGNSAFIIRSVNGEQHIHYEVFPFQNLIQERSDIVTPLVIQPGNRPHFGRLLPFDWNAYESSAAPKEGMQSNLYPFELTEIDVENILREPETIGNWLASNYLFLNERQLYTQARGTTKFDTDTPGIAALKFIIPLWGGIDDIQQGTNQGDQGKVMRGIFGLTLDVASLGFPIGKGISRLGLAIKLSWNSGFRVARPSFQLLGKKLAINLLEEAFPLLSLYSLGKTLRSGAITLRTKAKKALSQLQKSWHGKFNVGNNLFLNNHVKRLPHTQGYYRRLLENRVRVVVLKDDDLFYCVDRLGNRPFGPSLTDNTPGGRLSRKRPRDIPVWQNNATWKFTDTFPDLDKTVIYWGDEIYLQIGSTLYKKNTLANASNVWRRTPARAVNRLNLPPLQLTTCRVKRGQDLQVCELVARNKDYVDVPATNTQGTDIVPWFLNRSIEAAAGTKKLVHNSKILQIDGNRLSDPSPSAPPLSYKETLQATLLGGNDVFKQIRISGGIVNGIADTRTISAVIAKRKADNAQVLVTRADNNTYYRAAFAQDAAVELRRMKVQHIETADDLEKLTEDDYLVLIHNGAYDAHYQMQKTDPAVLATHRRQIADEIASGRLPALSQAPANPFEMGTDLVEAALFCKYTQFRFYLGLRSRLKQWGSISRNTTEHSRRTIADVLNDLTQTAKYNTDSVLNRNLTGALAGQKNCAFLKIEFNNGDPSKTYFSLSGKRKGGDYVLPLARHIDKKSPASGWTVNGGEAISPSRERYIDAQPKAGLNEPAETVVSIPATPSLFNTKVIDGTVNLRELDTERLIILRMEQDELDYSKVKSMLLFSKYPTCYSCTRLIDGLERKLPQGALNVFEGPQKSPR